MAARKYLLLGLVFVLAFQTSAKGKWRTGVGSVFGYNTKEIKLWKYQAESTFSRGIYFKIGYDFRISKKLSISLTPGIQQHHDIITIDKTKVSGYSYHFDIPIAMHYQFGRKWSSYMGFALQEYRMIDDVALNKSYNARVNFNIGLIHHFNQTWALELAYSRIISHKVDSFLFRNYTNHIHLGVVLNLHILKRKKHE